MPLGMEVDLTPQPRGLCFRLDPFPPKKFSAHVYYSYCDLVRTLRNRYWFAEVQVLFLEKSLSVGTYSVCSNINTEANIYRADGFSGSGRELNH